jgi:hypothetical protein
MLGLVVALLEKRVGPEETNQNAKVILEVPPGYQKG